MDLKDIRNTADMTQSEAAEALDISLRSYKSYENDENKKDTFRYNLYCEILKRLNTIDEEHGVLELDFIKKRVKGVFFGRKVNFCYLFGSYAKNRAKGNSDVDLLIDTQITGLDYYELVEELRQSLGKKVDLLSISQLNNNEELLRNILKDGIKIYG